MARYTEAELMALLTQAERLIEEYEALGNTALVAYHQQRANDIRSELTER